VSSPRGTTDLSTEVLPMIGEAICQAKNCNLAAAYSCAACGRPCCPNHVRQLVLERRDDSPEMRGHRAALGRVPTRTETYLLCLRCWSKPFEGLPRQQRAIPSPHTR
jgi:hypothetical protein